MNAKILLIDFFAALHPIQEYIGPNKQINIKVKQKTQGQTTFVHEILVQVSWQLGSTSYI